MGARRSAVPLAVLALMGFAGCNGYYGGPPTYVMPQAPPQSTWAAPAQQPHSQPPPTYVVPAAPVHRPQPSQPASPRTVTCPACGGRGRTTCLLCQGKRYLGMACEVCGGTLRLKSGHECHFCGKTGKEACRECHDGFGPQGVVRCQRCRGTGTVRE